MRCYVIAVAVATSRMEKGAALRDHQQVGASWSQQYAFQRNRSFSIHPDGNFTGAMLNTDAIIGGDGPMASPSPRKSPVGEAASDNMNISDDEDILLSSLLAQEIDDFVIKLDAADAALRA